MKLSDVSLRIIPDSRGQKTLEAILRHEKMLVAASVPHGKSEGSAEALFKNPERALVSFPSLGKALIGAEFDSQKSFDEYLINRDGTKDKHNLGGNVTLALSLAWARLKAKIEHKELYEYIGDISKFQNIKISKYPLPLPMFNMIEGGLHATHPGSRLEIQEFLVIPQVRDFREAFLIGKEFYKILREKLTERFDKKEIIFGDEAGFSAPFQKNEEALDALKETIVKNNFPARIGLDCAANSFFKARRGKPGAAKKETKSAGKLYKINGEEYGPARLSSYYKKLIQDYDLIAIEDPFHENDFGGFARFKKTLKTAGAETLVVGDDLTVTNEARLKKAVEKEAGDALIVKPNQVGTLTEALMAARLARESGWEVIASHRSGETRDDFIADLAVGVGAWGIKAGAPATPERLSKYNRLLEISRKVS